MEIRELGLGEVPHQPLKEDWLEDFPRDLALPLDGELTINLQPHSDILVEDPLNNMKEVQEGQSSGLIIDSGPNMLFSTEVEKLSRLEESRFHEINIVNGINYFKRILSERAKELERTIVEISSTS